LVESVVLSVTGGLLGCLVAVGGLRWFDSGMGTMEKPTWLHLSLDRSALLYLAAISVGVGILFGLAPALQLAKADANAALKEGGGHGVVGNKLGLRLSRVLVGIQMALCVVLLVGAGLMIHGAVNMYSTPIGVNTKNVLTMRINLPEAKYPTPQSWIAFHESLNKRLAALPGVELASIASNMPLGGWIPFSLEFDGRSNDAAQLPEVGCLVVGNNYFQTMQVEPRRGRLFADADGVAGPPVVVVNESFAAKYWPGEEPLGKRIRVRDENLPGAWLTVVGVVPDVLQNFRQTLELDPLIYVPFAEKPQRQTFLVARTGVPPASLSDPFRREVQRMDDNLAVYEVRTLENRIAESRLGVSLFGALYSVFAGVATLLAAVGLYAVIAHSVNQRRREIGLRMALGATRRDIMRLVLAQGIKPLVPGLAVGLLLALGVKRALPAAIVGVSSGDPMTFIAAIFVLLSAALLGCVVPARRAMRVDPMIALRCE
jgi:predicted permease